VLTAVISHAVWDRLFDRAPDVVGRTFRVNDIPVTVVGVAPRGFGGSTYWMNRYGVWLPLAAYPVIQRSGMQVFSSPDSARFNTVALLRPGVDTEQAIPTVKAIAARADAARTPRVAMLTGGPMRWIATADVAPMTDWNEDPEDEDEIKQGALLMGAFTFLLLLITCANVSSLLVGIAVSRRREIAVRLSLGAARTRLIGQLLTESVLLASAAAALGMFTFWAVLRAMTMRFPGAAFDQAIVIDWRSTLFTIGFAILTGLLFGLSPALHATRLALADVLKDAGRAASGSRSILQRALVVVQITLTQPLLVAVAALLLLSVTDIQKLTTSELDERIVNLNFNVYSGVASTAERHSDMARVQERLRGLPAVAGAATEGRISSHRATAHPADRQAASPLPDTVRVNGRMVAPGYLALWDIRILRGRDFLASEMDTTISAVIIGDRFARGLFGNADPIGRRLRFDRDSLYMEVIGIADEAAMDGLRPSTPDTYQPIIFWPINTVAVPGRIVVRTHAPAEPFLPHLRVAALSAAPHLPLDELRTVQQSREENRRSLLQGFAAIGAAGLLALFLSAIGLYAVVSFAVNQRTREIGIRTALGAHRGQVVRLFFNSGVRLSAFGLVLGLPLSLIALRILGDLAGIESVSSAGVAASVALGVLIVAALATWLPARRAAAVDPLTALRAE
jgi:predicted permease